MKGTIVKIQKYSNHMFMIKGEDGTEYFSHKGRLINDADWKYCYKGNQCEFIVVDEGKQHLVAENVKVARVKDPDYEVKKERKKQQKIF